MKLKQGSRITRLVCLIMSSAVMFTACNSNQSVSPVSNALIIHQNQLAFDTKAHKSIVVSVSKGLAVSGFEVLDADNSVFSGQLVAHDEFSEWGEGRDYYTADFSEFTEKGHFEVKVVADRSGQTLLKRSSVFEILDNAYFKTTMTDVLKYFKANRYTHEKDRNIRVYGTEKYVDVWGGWMDAGGDTGKYLSHLSYANYMNPQQGAIVSWVLAKSYESIPALYEDANLEKALLEETLWGADYLHRILDDKGYFYMTVFDQWGSADERVITGYTGLDGALTENYQAAFREGGGIAIAALARSYGLSLTLGKKLSIKGEFMPEQYLLDAERAFEHLQEHNEEYCDNGEENIIDDYTALIAATELYRVTKKDIYLTAMQQRADNLVQRSTAEGWFVSDNGSRPYYHAAEAGMPVLALADFLSFAKKQSRIEAVKETIKNQLQYQLTLNSEVTNPFNYARQTFKSYSAIYGQGEYSERQTGFFIPHKNETAYWWQGENARLASLTAAAIWGGKISHKDSSAQYGIDPKLGAFAQNQMDWILGRNPYDMCMLYGFGENNPPFAESGGSMVKGGISNGITGATASEFGRGITWAEGPDENNWRWVEQWLQHSSWYVLAVTAMSENKAAD